MAVRTANLVMTFALSLSVVGSLVAQPPLGGEPKSPAELFRTARDQIQEGRFDVAANTLKNFLASAQGDKDYLELMAREPTIFQKLRAIPIWSEDPKAQAEARATVNEIIKRSEDANKKLYRDPTRITKFVRNLGATQEERIYAEYQLQKAGDAVVPVMVESLRTSSDIELRAGIFGAISKLGPETIPGFLAGLEGLSGDARLGILRGLTNRTDVLSLLSTAETDFTPHLWYLATDKDPQNQAVRLFSLDTLEKLGANPAKRLVEAELVRLATPFTNKNARYRFSDRIQLWSWDGTQVQSTEATREQADEFYGIRYLKWANERNPNYLPAQELFLSFSIQRAIEKGKFGELATINPALFQVAASSSTETLIRLLEQAITDRKTALALGLTQLLSARADRTAVTGLSSTQPGVLIRVLDYNDPRVQLAAAIAIMQSQITTHGKTARIVAILQKALAAETGDGASKEMGRVLISDPDLARGVRVSSYLEQLGYVAERFSTGQQLLRRAAKSNDFDLVVLDRHTSDPQLRDVLAQLRPTQNVARIPILVLASSDKSSSLPLESLMLRLAKLIAVTETASIEVPAPFSFDPNKAFPDVEAAREKANRVRDYQLQELHKIRTDRLNRIMSSIGLPVTEEILNRVDVRASQLTYAVLSAEYGISATSAPTTFQKYQLLNQQIGEKKVLHTALEGLRLDQLRKILEQFDAALDPGRQKLFEQLTGRVITDHLNLPDDQLRDPELEQELSRQLRTFPAVSVIPEPYSLTGLTDDVRNAAEDPAQLPRDLDEKKQSALKAVQWLRKLALGEIPGYDVRPAEPALLAALGNNLLAGSAIDAVAKISSAPCQQDLVSLAITVTRPAPLRAQAADRAIEHIQTFGKLIPANQKAALIKAIGDEQAPELRAKLVVLSNLLSGQKSDLGQLINSYPVPVPMKAANPMPKDAAIPEKMP